MNPDDLPPLREVIAAHELRAQKSLGQNFLLDLNITDKIARAAGNLDGCTVFEIGPGPGGLTRALAKTGAEKIIAVEFDPRAIAALQSLKLAYGERVEIVHGDALRINLLDFPAQKRAIVANLPYNIATPLLTGWLKQMREMPGCYDSMTLMFQREVAERITAQRGTKDYGRLSVLCQWIAAPYVCFDLPPSVFSPPPKVSSSVVRFLPKVLSADAPPLRAVEKVTAAAFGQRRKMIRTSLKDYAVGLEKLEIDGTLRAENLTVDQFVELARVSAL